ncbi:MAG: DUF1735 domain-containing protein [Bacteroidota bacterium]
MKININKIATVFLAVCALGLSSCLKENEDTYTDFTKVGTTVELPLAALNQETNVKVVTKAYTASAAGSELEVFVNIASPKTLSSNLTVTLGVNPAALTALNASGGGYILLPTTGYTASNMTVTIPAGQRVGSVKIKLNTSAISKTEKKYILPISITDAGGQPISLYNTVSYNVQVN